jgi:HK97 gp10 family phage protein
MGRDFVITGVKALDRKLKALEPKVAKKVIRQALRKAAKPVQARTRALAPVGETGQVKRAVKIRASTRTRKKVIRLRVLIGKGDFVGQQFYGAFAEYGTKQSGTGRKGGRRRPGQKGQHFMKRAFDQTKDQARRIAIDEITAGIEREAKG